MTEAVLDSPASPDKLFAREASAELVAEPPRTPASRLQKYIRAGKFSPEVAAQLDKVLNSDAGQIMADATTAPRNELYVVDMFGNMALGCVFAVLLVGAVGLSVAVFGILDSYLMVVAGLVFVFAVLGVVAIGSLNQAPAKPRPPKPTKTPKSKAAKPGAEVAVPGQ